MARRYPEPFHRVTRRSRWVRSSALALVLSLLVAMVALINAVPASGASSGGLVRPSRLAPAPLPADLHFLGSLPASQPVSLEVVLSPSNPAGIAALLGRLYGPGSAQYHQWLAPGAFDRDFAPAPSVIDAVSAWLERLGLRPAYTSGFTLTASGSSAQVSRGLGIAFDRYRANNGSMVFASRQAPQVPPALGDNVAAILGLEDTSVAVPMLASLPRPAATPASNAPSALAPLAQVTTCPAATQLATQIGGLTPDGAGTHYGIDTLIGDGADGVGQKVAVLELASSSPADIDAYESCVGLHVPVTVVPVDGGGGSNTAGTQEADLDIEQLATQAPSASITSYEGPDDSSGVNDVWSQIVDADNASVISASWGLCEASAGGLFTALDPLFEQASAQGQAIFAAAGDDGSEDCFNPPVDNDNSLAVDYPASSPWVTAVGGTSLSLNGSETVWNGCQGVSPTSGCGPGSGGGGVSADEPKPLWQSGLTTPAGFSCGSSGTNCREVPDVSANAGVPEVFYTGGQWTAFVGTSLAAPLVAGLWADRESACQQSTSGDAAPTFYGAQGDYGTALTDITRGNNDLTGTNGGQFAAGVGYDLASGLGSPIGPGLACAEVTAVTPSQAPAGAEISVTGLGLENATISFGRLPATVVSSSATALTVVVPAGSGSVIVSASGPLGDGTASASFTYGTPVGLLTRLYGATAIGTAIAVSMAQSPVSQSVPAVVLARSDFFSDALAGGPLAAKVGGPLLITPGADESSTLDPSVEQEIQRVLKPNGTVYVLGGNLALGPTIDTTLEGLGYQVQRLAGADEYDTAVLIAQQMGNPATIFEATGLNFPDALSAVPAAVADHGAILLTDGNVQAPETAAYLAQYPRDTRYAIGGPLAAAGADPGATAVYGQDLFATSAAVAAFFFPHPTFIGAATGTNFPDALAAGPVLGLKGAPLVLVEPSGPLPGSIAAYLRSVGAGLTQGTLFGGPLAVVDDVLAELDAATG